MHKAVEVEARKSSNGHSVVARKAHNRPPVDPNDPEVNRRKGRSQVTNGTRGRVFVEADQRGPWTRRFKDVLAQIVSDLGGADILSEGQRQIARRAATISIMCEKLEGQIAMGEDVDLEQYGQLTDRLGRCFNRLGLKRQAKDITPSLGQLIAQGQARERERLAQARAQRSGGDT
jgi:hypothetical protein